MAKLESVTSDLTFELVDSPALWSIQGNRESSLSDFEIAVFGKNAEIGELLISEPLRLLRLWPHQSYLLTGQQPLPPSTQGFETLMTDITDAYCSFRIYGADASHFIANYLTANLTGNLTGTDSDPACLRCRLGQYSLILWWHERQDLQLLLERSFAQSFADYIDTLLARWLAEAP